MQLAEYIFQQLADWGVKHVFTVTGGGAMFLNNALGKQHRIQYICPLHEQAGAMAAEGYARIKNLPGVICVTSGPGGTNAITGVTGAWLDSIPMLVISGQVKTETLISACPELALRQLGDQELNIIDIVRPVTKYASCVKDASQIRYELEKAWFLAQSGRPGPVWLDIPLDIQAAEIYPERLPAFTPEIWPEPPNLVTALTQIKDWLSTAQRPVIIAGGGVHSAQAEAELRQLVEQLDIPVLTTLSGADLIPSAHPNFGGRPGIIGNRGANFIMQNADLLIVLGTRMNLRIIGYNFAAVARKAKRIMVDVDAAELHKTTFRVDLPICADVKTVLNNLLAAPLPRLKIDQWREYCRTVSKKYPAVTTPMRQRTDYVSSYVFAEFLGRTMPDNAIVVTGNGTAYTSTFQAIELKPTHRLFANVGCASMGYGLPAAIGAQLAAPERPVICVTGDGSIQMNIQELQTVQTQRLPLKIFVFNNNGYLSIKLTQQAFANGHFMGADPASGVILPDLQRIAECYQIKYLKIANHQQLNKLLPQILNYPHAVFCEVMLDPLEALQPKAASKRRTDGTMVSRPLEDMAPFLSREELADNMIIDLWPEGETEL